MMHESTCTWNREDVSLKPKLLTFKVLYVKYFKFHCHIKYKGHCALKNMLKNSINIELNCVHTYSSQ